jgi:lipopolysaccharide transport system permease protein
MIHPVNRGAAVYDPSRSRSLSASLTEGAYALHNFLRHRDLLWQMVGNDLRGRYVGSLLGLFWNVIHPLIQIGIYTLVFSQLMGARLGNIASPYGFSIYLCAGLLPWGAFAEVVNRCTGVFWENANLVKKIAFPKVLLHAYVVAASATNLAIIVAVFLVFLWLVDAVPPLIPLLVWGLFLLLQLLFAMGIGFCTSVLNVFFRDVAQITAVFLQIWFWLTPIVYVSSVLPPSASDWLQYNIMARFASVHQALVLRGELPSLAETLLLSLTTLLTLLVGIGCFRLLRRRIPDEL